MPGIVQLLKEVEKEERVLCRLVDPAVIRDGDDGSGEHLLLSCLQQAEQRKLADQ